MLPYISSDDAFCLTYGDGVGDVDITKTMYCSPVLRHPAGLIQAANFRSAIAF